LECSHGFRPGRSCHTAIQALMQFLYENDIQTVIDIDLKNFFGTISHEQMENILREKIKDPKFMQMPINEVSTPKRGPAYLIYGHRKLFSPIT
jgi:retron-type reverse transcriptase